MYFIGCTLVTRIVLQMIATSSFYTHPLTILTILVDRIVNFFDVLVFIFLKSYVSKLFVYNNIKQTYTYYL